MLVDVVIVVGVILAGLLAYAASRPNTFRVTRSQSVQAPADRIFPHIADFHKWSAWSPWEKLDPAMKKTYSGAGSGKGAVYGWAGNDKAGQGRMEIVDAAAPSLIRIKLDFLKPFEAHNTAEFALAPQGGSTEVTWTMYGPQSFMLKAMSLFMSMDSMVGKDFAAGLASLKTIAESQTPVSRSVST
jgi:hypothetical protein